MPNMFTTASPCYHICPKTAQIKSWPRTPDLHFIKIQIQAHYILCLQLWSSQLEPGCSQPVPLRVFPHSDIFNPFWEQRKLTRKHCILQNRLGANTDWKTLWKQTRTDTHAHALVSLTYSQTIVTAQAVTLLCFWLFLSFPGCLCNTWRGVASLPPLLPTAHWFLISGSAAEYLYLYILIPVFSLACHCLVPWGFPLTRCCGVHRLPLGLFSSLLYPSPSQTPLPEELSALHRHCHI